MGVVRIGVSLLSGCAVKREFCKEGCRHAVIQQLRMGPLNSEEHEVVTVDEDASIG